MLYNIKNRVFILGCPRSGTTLLQSLIAAHNDFESFPETHYFKYTVYNNYKFLNTVGIASVALKKRVYNFLDEINRQDLKKEITAFDITIKSCTRKFINILDKLAIENGKRNWVEKTPEHLRYIDIINKYIENPKFIHIIRNGKDVIASLYEVTNNYPSQWGGKLDLNQCLELWIEGIEISKSYLCNSNHFFLRYEELVCETVKVLEKLFAFLEVNFDRNILNNYTNSSEKIILVDERWKTSNTSEIKNLNDLKFNNIFNEKEKDFISNKISSISLDKFSNL